MVRLLLVLGIIAASLVQLLGLPVSIAAPVVKEGAPDLIQGTWKVVKLEYNGEVNTDRFREGIWIFKDKEITLRDTNGKEWFSGTFVLDADKTPMTIDITWSDGPLEGKVEKGIYKIEKDTLKLSRDTDKRPDGFTDAGKTGKPSLVTFERLESK